MLERLGKRKFMLPIGIMLAIGCVFSLIFYPIANMEMKNLPFAIVCLDEGIETTEGDVNLGELVVDKVVEATEEEGAESPIAWTKLASQEELDQAMANNEYFGALVIPRDFSQQQYATLVDTMQSQIDEMSDSIGDALPFSSGGLSIPALGGSANSASPQLSAEAQAMIAGAQGVLASATQQAQSAAGAFQQDQAAFAKAQQELVAANEQVEQLQQTIDDAKAQRAEFEQQRDALQQNPTPSANDQALIDQLTQQIDELDTTIATSEQQLEQAKAALSELSQAVEKAQQNVARAGDDLATAQANAKTAAANAMGVQKTAIASSALSTQATALKNALASLKDKFSSIDIAGQLDDMSDTIAAKALVNIADQLEEGADDEAPESEGAKLFVFLDMAKSPMVANTMSSTMKALYAEVGMQADVITIHDGTPEGATMETAQQAAVASDSEDSQVASNPMSTMMSMQILMIPTIMLSLIIGLIITRLVKLRADAAKKQRVRALVKQIVLALVFSGLVALTAFAMYALVIGGPGDFASMTMFIWLVSFAVMLAIGGIGNIALGLGVLVAVCTIAFGMMTGILPQQALPAFWQDWVFPWAPQHYFGDGIRSILYLNEGWWNAVSPLFAWLAVVGIIISAIALFIPNRAKKTNDAKAAEMHSHSA